MKSTGEKGFSSVQTNGNLYCLPLYLDRYTPMHVHMHLVVPESSERVRYLNSRISMKKGMTVLFYCWPRENVE